MGQLGEGWEPGWHVGQWSPCTPRLVLDGLGAAALWLDGEPDPSLRRQPAQLASVLAAVKGRVLQAPAG